MQTSTSATEQSSARELATTALHAMPRGAFETRHRAGREVSVVDGLMSVTQRAWNLRFETDAPDAGVAAGQ